MRQNQKTKRSKGIMTPDDWYTIFAAFLVLVAGFFAGMCLCEYKHLKRNQKLLKDMYENYRLRT